jgi:hypothetical protein
LKMAWILTYRVCCYLSSLLQRASQMSLVRLIFSPLGLKIPRVLYPILCNKRLCLLAQNLN